MVMCENIAVCLKSVRRGFFLKPTGGKLSLSRNKDGDYAFEGFENAKCGGWGYDVIRDACDLHFGTGKEGVIAGNF